MQSHIYPSWGLWNCDLPSLISYGGRLKILAQVYFARGAAMFYRQRFVVNLLARQCSVMISKLILAKKPNLICCTNHRAVSAQYNVLVCRHFRLTAFDFKYCEIVAAVTTLCTYCDIVWLEDVSPILSEVATSFLDIALCSPTRNATPFAPLSSRSPPG